MRNRYLDLLVAGTCFFVLVTVYGQVMYLQGYHNSKSESEGKEKRRL